MAPEQQTRLEMLFTRYLEKTATPAERVELGELISEAENQEELFRIFSAGWERFHSEEESIFSPEKREEMLRAILGKKQLDIFIRSINHFNWRRLAAAAAIFILLASGGYLLFLNRPRKELLQANSLLIQDIKPPGSNNAIITLSNGKTIILDSAGKGTLATQGNVHIEKLSDGQIAYSGSSNEIVYNTLTNPRGSKVVNLTLSDGTEVWLNNESSLRYPTAFTGGERKVEITGEAYFEVAHNASHPFIVTKNNTQIKVLGTHFNVNAYDEDNSIKVTLLEGSVRVINKLYSAIIRPGQQAKVNESIKVENETDLEQVMAWKNGKFNYHNTDLETIMQQIARWYDVEVVYKDKIADRYTVDISRDVPVSQLFRFIEMSGGVHFEIEGKQITVNK